MAALQAAAQGPVQEAFVEIAAVETTKAETSKVDISAFTPTIIGADGPELTQVCRLGCISSLGPAAGQSIHKPSCRQTGCLGGLWAHAQLGAGQQPTTDRMRG